MMHNTSYIHAISFVAPGLPDWPQTRAVLRGEAAYQPAELATYQPDLLPPNERRRASSTVRMAFRIAEELTRNKSIAADQLACVFSSADGDLAIAQRICNALAEATRLVSPTDFHNSVHNAPAGYWSIAANAKGPSTAIAAYDYSFAAALLEAHGMVQVEQQPTLLVVYDIPAPKPLHASRPVSIPAGVGLLLRNDATNAIASVTLDIGDIDATHCNDSILESLRISNPAARALPLLQAIATGKAGNIVIPLDDRRSVNVTLHLHS
ncbi:MAG TPA: beta-ketoacyl synthase chain length factor [Steroidobacteraceae bacterium]|nr:beta-ketoacyl synthase chain length factor [Steroidobacteraceae bacterium]